MKAFARVRLLLATLSIALMLVVTAAPAGAYYGQVDGARYFNPPGLSGKGCYAEFYVVRGMAAQVFCDMENPSTGSRYSKTNYHEYTCPDASYCYYYVFISGSAGYRPLGFWTMRKTNANQTHTIIMHASPQG